MRCALRAVCVPAMVTCAPPRLATQSLSVAPLFAFFEGVWALGMRPELHAQTLAAVAKQRAEMCAAGGSFSFCK